MRAAIIIRYFFFFSFLLTSRCHDCAVIDGCINLGGVSRRFRKIPRERPVVNKNYNIIPRSEKGEGRPQRDAVSLI